MFKISLYLLLTFIINTRYHVVTNVFKVIDIKPEDNGKLKLFILAGQSNMSGSRDLADFVNVIDSNKYLFGNDYKSYYAQAPIDNENNQKDKCSIDNLPGVRPASSFAKFLINIKSS